MLKDKMVAATLPVVDMERARKFYEDKLGLKVMQADKGGVMLQAGGGTALFLYQRGPTKADHTVASFNVDNIEAEMSELGAKGVVFEEYDMPQMHIKTVNGLATMDGAKMAWFKDTEGNILSITQM
jgi:catechol 2,3-dioxygenase-like lactoylglutathione lyase family enzyme